MPEDQQTRERVRDLVRDVLLKVVANEQLELSTVETVGQNRAEPTTRFVGVANTTAKSEPEFDRDESAKTIITEDDLRGLETNAKLRIAENARFTALAEDVIRDKNIELIRKTAKSTYQIETIAVGADHGGYATKEQLKALLTDEGYQVRDLGTNSEAAVDYPDFARAVARAVSEGQAEVGIIIDGAGIGSAITANKVPGVRAAACYTVQLAQNSREHNDANVLTLGSKINSASEIIEIVRTWLSAQITEERHQKRVAKIVSIERQYLK